MTTTRGIIKLINIAINLAKNQQIALLFFIRYIK